MPQRGEAIERRDHCAASNRTRVSGGDDRLTGRLRPIWTLAMSTSRAAHGPAANAPSSFDESKHVGVEAVLLRRCKSVSGA